jgi:hypothetical protein
MAYVPGEPLGMYLEHANADQSEQMISTLVTCLQSLYEGSLEDRGCETARAVLARARQLSEIESIQDPGLPFLSLAKFVQRILQDIKLRQGWHHGDFSMENILCTATAGELWAIDYLDSPANAPLIDWGRLWLDCKYGWWVAGISPSAAWLINANKLARNLELAALKLGVGKHELDCFAAFAILRIVPYTKNPIRMAFLKSAARDIVRGNPQ